MKIALGFVIAFGIGAFCRWMDIPVPAPPALAGVLLVLAMTLGYMSVDRLKAAQPPEPPRTVIQAPRSNESEPTNRSAK